MEMTIRTKRKNMLNHDLTKDTPYNLISIVHDPSTASGISVTVEYDNDSNRVFDSGFFRMNSIKIKK